MTILEIFVLCHMHAIAEPYDHPSPAANKAICKFLQLGLIVEDTTSSSGYRTTPRGGDVVARLKAVTP